MERIKVNLLNYVLFVEDFKQSYVFTEEDFLIRVYKRYQVMV